MHDPHAPKIAPEPSYKHHPVDDMEPLPENHLKEDMCLYFRRLFVWMLDGANYRQRSMRFHIIGMLLFPEILSQTCESIAADHQVSRYATNKLAQDLRDRYAISTHLQNRSMRNNSTREKCRQSQIKNYQEKKSSTSNGFTSRLKLLRKAA